MRRLGRTASLAVILAVAGCGPTAAPSSAPASPTAQATPAPTPRPTPSPTPSVTVAELIGATTRTVSEGTLRIEFEMRFEGSSLIADGLGITGEGQASLETTRQMTMTMDMKAFGLGSLDMIQDDRIIYMRGAAFQSITGDAETWLRIDVDSDHPLATELASTLEGQNDTSLAVYYLYGLEGDIEFVGAETVGSVETEHYRADLDLDEAIDKAPEAVVPLLEENIGTMLESGIDSTLAADLWLGDDGLIRKLEYALDLGEEMGGGQMIIEMLFSDFGDPLELDLPSSFEYVDLEDVAPA